MKAQTIFLLFFLVGSSIFAQQPSASKSMNSQTALNTVSTTGKGSIYVAPDEVHFSIDINVEAGSLIEAQKENKELASKAIAYLKQQGVEDRHIQTQYLNVSVQYRDRDQQVPRYYANQTIRVCLKDVGSYEAVNMGLLERGITGLRGPNFAASNVEELREQARVLAVKDAKVKATALAGALDQKIGAAVTIDDSETQNSTPLVYARAMTMDAESGSSGPGIATGEIEVVHKVNVTFQLLNE